MARYQKISKTCAAQTKVKVSELKRLRHSLLMLSNSFVAEDPVHQTTLSLMVNLERKLTWGLLAEEWKERND